MPVACFPARGSPEGEKSVGRTKSKGTIFSAITQTFVDTIRTAGVYASKSWFDEYIRVDVDTVWLAPVGGKADLHQTF